MSEKTNRNETMALTEWLENQKARAENNIADKRVGYEETLKWKGERELIDSMQNYIEMGVLELE